MRLFEAIIDANHRAVAGSTKRAALLRKVGLKQLVRPYLQKSDYQ
jgi:hypothetical protein